MKTIPARPLLFFLLGIVWLPANAQRLYLDSASTAERPVYTVVQQQPEFTGGMRQLGEYLRKNLRYPQSARMGRVEGRVFINFMISEQGTIEQVRVLKGLSPELDAEAVRLVQNMPNWKPGRQDGKAVACRYNLPINFSPNEMR